MAAPAQEGRGQSWFGYDLSHIQSPVGVRSFSLGGGAKLALQEGGDVEVSIELGPMKAKPGGRNLYVGQGYWRSVGETFHEVRRNRELKP